MQTLFHAFFYVPKRGKIREKVMFTRFAITIAIVVMCLAAMSITAYAYFSYTITSGSNRIKTAHFEASVSITITENDNRTAVEVAKQKNMSCTADLQAGKTYTITLHESDSSTAKTGFCLVSAVGCRDIYHSQQIGADATVEGGNTNTVTFQLMVTADTTVTFLSHWGTSSHYVNYSEKGENDRLYITNADRGENKDVMIINTEDATTSTTEAPVANETTPSETTGTSESTATTTTDTQATAETPSATETTVTTSATTTVASE